MIPSATIALAVDPVGIAGDPRGGARLRAGHVLVEDILNAFRTPWHYSVDLWKYWDAIGVPILVIRGQQSDLLSEAVLKDMMRRNRNVRVHTVADCGHAPALIADDQRKVVFRADSMIERRQPRIP